MVVDGDLAREITPVNIGGRAEYSPSGQRDVVVIAGRAPPDVREMA